ncbi:cell division protein FtsL [Streptococcus hillyeri]|uniref:Cell division protein FtsL n=1 Tax=Streptococcus hillyeri TaxID=2282420 RepID=A0A3L9DLZ8_9STRE|nr:cell division protein FtsL [Streptococcus hillyeri]RLY02301.1 cell division protein FtsL [Streptococcus hillyeri]
MPEDKRQEALSQVVQRRIRQFTRLEKAFYGTIILTAIVMAISLIYIQSRNLQLQQTISELNGELNLKQTEYNNAKQEVNELLQRERIIKVAEEAGLVPRSENIQKVE